MKEEKRMKKNDAEMMIFNIVIILEIFGGGIKTDSSSAVAGSADVAVVPISMGASSSTSSIPSNIASGTRRGK